jgi:hypothetical protein
MTANAFIVPTVEDTFAVSQGLVHVGSGAAGLASSLPPIKRASDLLQTPLVQPPQLIQGVLHKGLKGVLASSSKAGKTWMLLDMALSVASGLPWLKWKTTKANVLLINFEIPEYFIQQRIEDIQKKKAGADLSALHVWTLRGYSTDFSKLLPEIGRRVQQEGYGLIILDPIYKSLAGSDENKAGDIAQFCNSLESLCVQTGAAVVYAHHFSKGNKAGQDVLDRMSGSGVFTRDADTIISLTRHEEENCYTVDLTVRNLKQTPSFVVQWNFPLMEIREGLDSADLAGKGGRPSKSHQADLLALLQGKGLTSTEFQKEAFSELDMSEGTFNRELRVLKESLKITKNPGTRKWQVSAAPSPVKNKPAEEESQNLKQ